LTDYEINSKVYEVEYDLDNRVITVDVNNSDVEYRYDALGRRVIRKEGSDKTTLIWWGNSENAEYEHSAGQSTIQNDIMSHPTRLNSVIARAVDGSKFDLEWYHKNYLDHVYAVSDDSGDLNEHYRYTAFGEVTIYNNSGTVQSSTQINNTITWNTRRLDSVSNYYLYKYRHYDPQLGRWPSRDPIEEDGGVNLYGFVGNDGINTIDLLGLWKKVEGTAHTWCADDEFDTLHGLAAQYGDKDSWSCLWPTSDTEDSGAYDWGIVRVGDKYDASNLVTPCTDNKGYFSVNSKRVDRGGTFNVTFAYIAGGEMVEKIRTMSGEGATPITELLIYGHSWDHGVFMSGDDDDDNNTFFYIDLINASKPASFARAKQKKGPLRCWFCRSSSVRLAGCKTSPLAKSFANDILRKGSISWGTRHSIVTEGNRLKHYESTEKKDKVILGKQLGKTGKGAGIHSKTWIGYGGKL
jgi:RHS repeat-associated protein